MVLTYFSKFNLKSTHILVPKRTNLTKFKQKRDEEYETGTKRCTIQTKPVGAKILKFYSQTTFCAQGLIYNQIFVNSRLKVRKSTKEQYCIVIVIFVTIFLQIQCIYRNQRWVPFFNQEKFNNANYRIMQCCILLLEMRFP